MTHGPARGARDRRRLRGGGARGRARLLVGRPPAGAAGGPPRTRSVAPETGQAAQAAGPRAGALTAPGSRSARPLGFARGAGTRPPRGMTGIGTKVARPGYGGHLRAEAPAHDPSPVAHRRRQWRRSGGHSPGSHFGSRSAAANAPGPSDSPSRTGPRFPPRAAARSRDPELRRLAPNPVVRCPWPAARPRERRCESGPRRPKPAIESRRQGLDSSGGSRRGGRRRAREGAGIGWRRGLWCQCPE